MPAIKSPCLLCDKRHIGCHSKCSEYLSYVDKKDALNAEIRKKKYLDRIGRTKR